MIVPQAAVDASHQVIVAADVTGSGSEQSMLLPMIEQTDALNAFGIRSAPKCDRWRFRPAAHVATELMKRAIDSARGRSIYSQRIATVEPVFANLRHNKRLDEGHVFAF